MTLRGRLLLSALLLCVIVTTLFALVIRRAWQVSEEARFLEEYQGAVSDLDSSLKLAGENLRSRLIPLCEHDPMLDSALIGLQGDSLPSRMLSLQATIPEMARSLGLDDLILVTDQGQVLAGIFSPALPGEVPVADVQKRASQPGFVLGDTPAFEAACLKKGQGRWVALLGRTHLGPLLEQQGKVHHLNLELVAPGQSAERVADSLSQETYPPSLDGAGIVARRSRQPLSRTFEKLNTEIASAFGLTVLVAFVAAFIQSRSLARPIVQFARNTLRAAQGKAEKIPAGGGKELNQAAEAFNQTLDALEALRKQLAVTERIAARREVARKIAHEIKNPLSPIRTSIETLQKLHARQHPEFDDYFKETTRIVLHEVMRLSHLVGHFAKYASLPSPTLGQLDIQDLCRRVVALHNSDDVHIQLISSANAEGDDIVLPPITADVDQITQVLTNLVKNAVEATMQQSQREVRVELQFEKKREVICVEVLDNGPGVSDEAQLFEPYKTTKVDGTGLGLPISHRIAVEHGGDLTYRTRSEGGAAFRLILPIAGPPRLAEPS